MATYETHDNGGRPFLVKVEENNDDDKTSTVTIIKQHSSTTAPLVWKALRVFIGRDSNYPGPNFDGCGILLHLDDDLTSNSNSNSNDDEVDESKDGGKSRDVQQEEKKEKEKEEESKDRKTEESKRRKKHKCSSSLKYAHIGSDIRTFHAYAPIVDYIAVVGNSDVIYPYAVDENGGHYLLIEDVFLSTVPKDCDDVYNFYYGQTSITSGFHRQTGTDTRNPAPPTVFKGIKGIQVGEEQYNLSYHPTPSPFFWRNPQETPTVVYEDGTTLPLTREHFSELMREFEAIKGWRHLLFTVVEPRQF